MKTFLKIAFVALIIGSVTLTSCKKYPDGPTVSLLTKKMRLVGAWTVEAYLHNGADQTSSYRNTISSETITVDKAGTWTETGTTAFFNISFSDNGTWAFANSKDDLTVVTTSNNPTTTETWNILKLKNKEFWYKHVNGSNTDEYHLIAK